MTFTTIDVGQSAQIIKEALSEFGYRVDYELPFEVADNQPKPDFLMYAKNDALAFLVQVLNPNHLNQTGWQQITNTLLKTTRRTINNYKASLTFYNLPLVVAKKVEGLFKTEPVVSAGIWLYRQGDHYKIKPFYNPAALIPLPDKAFGETDFARRVKIIVERYPDGYTAYPLGLKGAVVGQGDTYQAALADIRSAINFHLDTFGPEGFEEDTEILEVFVAETEEFLQAYNQA